MKKYYRIADHIIEMEGTDLATALTHIDGFAPFETEPGTPFATVSTHTQDKEVPQMTRELYSTCYDDIRDHFGRYEGGYLFTMVPPEGETLSIWVADGSRTVWMKGQLMPKMVRFALWIAHGLVTADCGCIAIHTSCIVYRGRAVFFLGESGTGKSTHTRLWRENIMGCYLLNDDSPILRLIDGEVRVYGSPWSGKTPCYKQESHPLAACVRLSQAPYNKIEKLSVLQGYSALHPSCPPNFAYDDKLYDGISATLGEVLKQVPVYHLACLPDAAAAHLSCTTVFGGEEA